MVLPFVGRSRKCWIELLEPCFQMGQSSSSSSPPPVCPYPENNMVEQFHVLPDRDFTLQLPNECLTSIFQNLTSKDRNACSLVCKRWHWVESKGRQRLVLLARAELSSFLSALVVRFEHVTVLALKCSRKLLSIDNKALCFIGKSFRQLKKLKLKGCIEITDEGVEAFSFVCGPLKKFSCGSCGFGAKGLNSVLQNCSKLEDLTVKRLRRLDSQTERIGPGQGKLQRLCLKDLHNGQLFAPLLSGSKHLRTLILSRNSGYWDQMFENITQNLQDLTELQIENMQLGDRGLIAVSRCPKLEVFYMSRVSDCTDLGISAVANGCRKLRKVHLDNCKLRRIGDVGILSIATKCPQLQEIVLMGIDTTAVSLNAFASNCPELERMALCNSEAVGDPELSCIAAKFMALKKLCIKNCPISDEGLETIASGCPNLLKLKVKRCKGVTSASVCWLKMNRGSLIVSVDSGSQTPAEDDQARPNQAGNDRVIRASTHVLCGSKGPFIKTKLGMAAPNFFRRPLTASQSQL
eukprot:Gb_34902 [translate_table: standard]